MLKLPKNPVRVLIPKFHGERKDISMGKIIKKVPMRQIVYTDDYNFWEYDFIDGKTIFSCLGNYLPIPNKDRVEIDEARELKKWEHRPRMPKIEIEEYKKAFGITGKCWLDFL